MSCNNWLNTWEKRISISPPVFTAKSIGINLYTIKVLAKLEFLNNHGMRKTLISQKPKARHTHTNTSDKFVTKTNVILYG